MDRNSLILDGSEQTLNVPFPSRIVGSAAAETVRIPSAGTASFTGNTGDRVELAGELAAYEVTAQGNQLVLDRDGGARVEVALNDSVEIAFADGTALADIELADGVAVTLGGEAAGAGFDPGGVQLDGADLSAIADNSGTGDAPPPDPAARLAVGFTDAPELDGFREPIRAELQDAWAAWAQHLAPDHDVTIDLEVGFEAKDGVLATAGPAQTWDTGRNAGPADIALGEPVHELRFGQDPRPASPDARMTIANDPGELGFGDEVQADAFHAESLFVHELGHVLGFTAFENDPARATPFEAGISDLTFTGERAGSVAILDDDTLSHLPNSSTAPDGRQSSMTSGLAPGETTTIVESEVAMLQDIGVPVTLDAFTAMG